MEFKDDRVWYASYGSNLSRDRFICYISGGKPPECSKNYTGCTNKDPPVDDKKIIIPHGLYFSKKSKIWENKGAAFIKSARDPAVKTLGRMYLITKEQFIEVVRQENGYFPNDECIDINFIEVINNGESFISERYAKWYGRIIYLGLKKNHHIFTFTAEWEDYEIIPNVPGNNYLKTIVRGIKEKYKITNQEIIDYLVDLDGIRSKMTKKNITKIVEHS